MSSRVAHLSFLVSLLILPSMVFAADDAGPDALDGGLGDVLDGDGGSDVGATKDAGIPDVPVVVLDAAAKDVPLAAPDTPIADAVVVVVDAPAKDLAVATPDAALATVDAAHGDTLLADAGAKPGDAGADAGPPPKLIVDGSAQGLVAEKTGCSYGGGGGAGGLGLVPFLAWMVIGLRRRRGRS